MQRGKWVKSKMIVGRRRMAADTALHTEHCTGPRASQVARVGALDVMSAEANPMCTRREIGLDGRMCHLHECAYW